MNTLDTHLTLRIQVTALALPCACSTACCLPCFFLFRPCSWCSDSPSSTGAVRSTLSSRGAARAAKK